MDVAEGVPLTQEYQNSDNRVDASDNQVNAEGRSAKFKPNYCHIIIFMIIMMLSGFTLSFGIGCTN